MAYKKLFEPGRIGGLTIRNRAVMSPMGTDLADIRGNATPRLIAYYTERAKGGIGLIINEYTGVDDVDSIPTQHNLRMAQDYNVQEAEELTRSVHAYGAKIFAQLHHGGATSKSAFTGRQNLSPSGVPMAPGGEVPREMTLEDIKRVQEKFIAAAIRCKKAGYDGVELHGAHSYLIAQFFSKYYNRRTDAYGGSLENRCRFNLEVIREMRKNMPEDMPLLMRLDAIDEMLPAVTTQDETVQFINWAAEAGVDAIDLSRGNARSLATVYEVPPYNLEPGFNMDNIAAIKARVNIPVIGVGRIVDPALADQLIREGKIDMVAVGRAQLADPEWCNKSMEGREAEIRRCIGCTEGCYDKVIDPKAKHITCTRNPALCLEYKGLQKTDSPKKVMIIGGGKTGFYLAKMLSEFGAAVKVIEKSKDRCRYLSSHLNDVMVLHGDATDLTLLEEENLSQMDAVVTATGYDEENLLLALTAKQHGIEDVIAKVSRASYGEIISRMGIDVALNPLDIITSSIIRFVQGSKKILSSQLIQGQAEIMEIIATHHMKILNKPLKNLHLPDGIIIAAIHRGTEDVIIPNGDTRILEDDKVILLSLLSDLPSTETLLRDTGRIGIFKK